MLVQKEKMTTNCFGKKIFRPKYFLGQKKIWSPRNFRPRIFLGSKNLGPKKILDLKNSRGQEIKAPKNCLVRIVSVRAVIFLIWTNDAGRNGTWTNVTVTDDIC